MKEIRRWDVMVRLIQQNGFSTFVEIGTKEGRTTHRVLQKTNAKVIACDPWQSQPWSSDDSGPYDRSVRSRSSYRNQTF